MATLTLWAFTPNAHSGITRLFAYAVCIWTVSKWSHIGISIGNKYYEAKPFVGVHELDSIPKGANHIATWLVKDDKKAQEWINKQLGKSYDWWGIFGFAVGPSEYGKLDKGHWFCSSFGVEVARKYGIHICGHTDPWEINPAHLVKSAKKIVDK